MDHEERLVSGELNSLDTEMRVRPGKLAQFLGQDKVKSNLNVFIDAAKQRSESIDHILFYGPPGLGKTTLSQIVAHEMDSNMKYVTGPSVTKSGDIAALLTNLETCDVLFIDEIHRLPIAVEEVLYSAMEDFKIDIMVGEGPTARSIRIELPHFTLIGATTRYGLLSNPLRDRFGITLQLEFYDEANLRRIIFRSAEIMKIVISEASVAEIARRSRGTPRVANRILKRVRDFLTISNKDVLDEDLTKYALSKLGVDASGLDALDRKYLTQIAKFYDGGPVGIDTIATMLSESRDTIEDTIEPYLIQKGFISRTTRGRLILSAGWEYLNIKKQGTLI